MQIREGAYYRTRGGDVVGPMRKSNDLIETDYPWISLYECWTEAGKMNTADDESEADLISEVYVSDTPPANAPAPGYKTLRDEFAMAALQGMLARESDLARNVARYAYEYADAMMEVRKK
jgi:hypothetical protein